MVHRGLEPLTVTECELFLFTPPNNVRFATLSMLILTPRLRDVLEPQGSLSQLYRAMGPYPIWHLGYGDRLYCNIEEGYVLTLFP
jgi:hypothetical protein